MIRVPWGRAISTAGAAAARVASAEDAAAAAAGYEQARVGGDWATRISDLEARLEALREQLEKEVYVRPDEAVTRLGRFALEAAGEHAGIDQVVFEQVDLVDVEHASVDAGEQPRRKGPLALAQAGLGDREPLPEPVHTQGHEVVHDVVASCDRVEHATHQAGLVAAVDLTVSEVGA